MLTSMFDMSRGGLSRGTERSDAIAENKEAFFAFSQFMERHPDIDKVDTRYLDATDRLNDSIFGLIPLMIEGDKVLTICGVLECVDLDESTITMTADGFPIFDPLRDPVLVKRVGNKHVPSGVVWYEIYDRRTCKSLSRGLLNSRVI